MERFALGLGGLGFDVGEPRTLIGHRTTEPIRRSCVSGRAKMGVLF